MFQRLGQAIPLIRLRKVWMFCLFDKLFWRLHWCLNQTKIKELERKVTCHVDRGEVTNAIVLLETQLTSHHWGNQVDELLFRRKLRPSNENHALLLLEALHRSAVLRPYQVFYAGIALCHQALKVGDLVRIHELRPWLTQVSYLGGAILSKKERFSRNRESVFKQLVSARSCLLQCSLALLEKDESCITAIGNANLSLLQSLRFTEISKDVLYRSSSNLMRGLLAISLTADQLDIVLPVVQDFYDWLSQSTFQPLRLRAKEDHLSMVRATKHLFEQALVYGAPSVEKKRLELMVNSDAMVVRQGGERWLRGRDIEIF
mgnify:CR=1 FL=1